MSHPIRMAWNVCLLNNTNSIIKRWFCLEQCCLNNDTRTSVALRRFNHLQKVHRKTSIISTSYYNYYLGRHHSSYTRNWSESIASTLNRFCINKKRARAKWNEINETDHRQWFKIDDWPRSCVTCRRVKETLRRGRSHAKDRNTTVKWTAEKFLRVLFFVIFLREVVDVLPTRPNNKLYICMISF